MSQITAAEWQARRAAEEAASEATWPRRQRPSQQLANLPRADREEMAAEGHYTEDGEYWKIEAPSGRTISGKLP